MKGEKVPQLEGGLNQRGFPAQTLGILEPHIGQKWPSTPSAQSWAGSSQGEPARASLGIEDAEGVTVGGGEI